MSLIGTTVGRIRIVGTLGKGGMGEVYLGYDETLKRKEFHYQGDRHPSSSLRPYNLESPSWIESENKIDPRASQAWASSLQSERSVTTQLRPDPSNLRV